MKKFFSAILLMTMMVFSVGTFVSCNDLATELEDVKNQTNVNAGAISDLESALTALQAKLASDYATKQELDAAKTALQGALDTEVADLEGQIAKINEAIAAINDAQKADADALANLSKLVDESIAAVQATVKELADAQAALKANTEANAGAIADLAARMTAAETAIKDIQAAAETFKTDIEALKTATMQNTEVITNLSVAYTNFQEVTEERLDKAEANIVALEAYVDQMVAEIYGRIETVEEALSAVTNLVADLETEDTAIYKEIEKLQESVSAVNNLINDLDAEDVKIYKEIEGALAAVSAVNALIEDLKNEDTQLYQQFNSLQETLSTVIMAVADLETVVAEIEDRLAAQEAALKAEVAALKEADAEAKVELDALKAAKDALDKKVADLEEKVLAFADAETVNAALDALKADVEAAKTALDEINKKLNNLSGMIDAITNQIQDVTFVPTAKHYNWYYVDIYEKVGVDTNGDGIDDSWSYVITDDRYGETHDYDINKIPSMEFYLGNNTLATSRLTSPLMVIATYEVRPAAAVETLTDDDLRFSTVETKVAPAQYFDAKIVDRDAESGRMLVVGYVKADENKELYNLIKGENIAVALDIAVNRQIKDEDGFAVTPDAGSYVTSDYIEVINSGTRNVAYGVQIAYTNAEGKTAYTTSTAYNPSFSYEVPYTPADETSTRSLFANYEGLVLDFSGVKLPIETAAEVLGFPLNVTYGNVEAKYFVAGAALPQGKVSPIVVTVAGENTTATLKGSADYKDPLHHSAKATFKSITLNETDLALTLTADYKIGYKQADITLTGETIKWSYKYGAEINYPEFPGLGSAAELDVDGTDDITKLKDAYGNQFSPTQYLTFYSEETDDYGPVAWVNIISLSKKAVRIVDGNIPFVKGEDHTYTFNARLYDEKNVEYTLSFDIKTSAMPTDKEIVLDAVTVDAKYRHEMTADINPIAAILEKDAAYYDDASLDLMVKAANTGHGNVTGHSTAALNGYNGTGNGTLTMYDNNGQIMDPQPNGFGFLVDYTYEKDGNTVKKNEETSVITIPTTRTLNNYTFKYVYNVFGVKYTFYVEANIAKATGYSLDVHPYYVQTIDGKDVVLLEHGTVKRPTVIASTDAVDTYGVPYKLEDIDLRDFVKVNGESDEDVIYSENVLRYTVKTKEQKPGSNPVAYWEGTDFGRLNDATTGVALDSTSTAVSAFGDFTVPFYWQLNEDVAKYRNEVEVEIALVANNANWDNQYATVYDTKIITLRVPELIKTAAVEPKYVAASPAKCDGAYSVLVTNDNTKPEPYWNPVNIGKAKAFQVYLNDGKAYSKSNWIHNQHPNTLFDYWNDNSGTAIWDLFGQTTVEVANNGKGYTYDNVNDEFTYAADFSYDSRLKAYLQNNPSVTLDLDVHYTVTPDGTVALTAANGITDNVIVEVPVSFKHNYCGTPHVQIVKVLFVK